MSQRIQLLAFVAAAGLVVAACGGGSTGTGTAPTASAAAAATQAAGQLPKPELATVRIGISTPNEPVQFAEKLADSLAIYQKYGITATVTGFEGDGKTLQALIAGQLDFMVGGASTAITSVTTDTPLKVIAMNSTTLTDGLWCTAAIKTAADVKGKSLAISTFGGTSHGAALLLLQGIGLTAKDAVVTQVGNQGTRIAALRGGSVGCGVIDMSQEKAMRDLGLNLVLDLSKAKLQWGRSGLQAKADFIAKNPNTTLVVVAATLEAQNSIWKDPATAATKFAEFAQVKPEDAKKAIDDFQGYGSRSMTFTEDAFKAPREVLGAVNPAMANVDVTKAFDLSFLKKLQDIGFNAKIGAPTTN